MLSKIKNLTNNIIQINDLGITISANGYYDLSSKKYNQSNDLILEIGNGTLVFVKIESPEELYNISESLQYIITGVISVPKISSTGENITLKNEHGHMPGNNIVNWTFMKYLANDESFSEKMYINFDKTITLNSFSAGSFNVPSSAILEYFEFNVEFNQDIRLNKNIRLEEYYLSTITTAPISNIDTVIVSNIADFDNDLIYQFETVDGSVLYRRVINIDIDNNEITLNLILPDFNNIPLNGKISLIDRPISQNDSQLSNNVINWSSPLRITGNNNNSYLKITITNEDDSEPGEINCSINGWIGSI